MPPFKKYKLNELVAKANTGLDAIKRAPIVAHDTGIKCLRIQDVSQSKDFKDWGFTEVSKDNYERFALKKDEIILARTGNTIGVNIFIDKDLKSVFNNGLIRLRTNKQICDPKYLYYNMQTTNYWSHIDSIAFGTSTQPNMQIESFLEYEIEMPDLPTQTRIAAILSSLDDKIELNRRTNQTLEQIAQTLFKKYFVDDIDPENLPEGWRWGKVDELGKILTGKTPPTKNIHLFNGPYPFLKIPDMIQIFPQKTILTLSQKGWEYMKNYILPAQSLSVSCIGTLGLVTINDKPTVTNQNINSIIFKDPHFLYYTYFNALQWENELDSLGGGGSVFGTVSKSKFSNIDIVIPETNRIKEFHNLAENIFKKIHLNILEIDLLIKTRDSLLPKLMSGEIEVNDAEKEFEVS